MTTRETKRACRSSNAPTYSFDTDSSIERVIRDPLSVLLGRSSLSIQADPIYTDPYNRVGRWARGFRR